MGSSKNEKGGGKYSRKRLKREAQKKTAGEYSLTQARLGKKFGEKGRAESEFLGVSGGGESMGR